MSKFNEDSRVKIPTVLHLCRLGYNYVSLKNAAWDKQANFFPTIFRDSLIRINEGIKLDEIDRLYANALLLLDYEDLGRAFYERLIQQSGRKLIDFSDFASNSFHVVTELPCTYGDEEFRPDITLLINGMPLAFIEVKKPNNKGGVLEEQERMKTRSLNTKFRKFINLTQLMVFSNNMEYDEGTIQPIQGAYYAASAYGKPSFNYFREEEELNLDELLRPENDELEDFVLKDNNLLVIKHSPEFKTNKDANRPTNRICTSLFSKERLAFMLRYSLAYVKEENGLQKHVMRYPQIFATKAITRKLDEGIRKGIIWHTQGSGKTALAYYNVKHLTDYFQRQQKIPKFYFIVDRLDLLIQASQEFSGRGLVVNTVNSRQEFLADIKKNTAIHNDTGQREITVVNIQKFSSDTTVTQQTDYNLNIQRIYFLDEVHRSYNPQGSFLANLTQSDPNSIKIGLTGTPLIGETLSSKQLFGDYIHKYYYNKSIADGYTLRLIREEIATNYRLVLAEALEKIEVLVGSVEKRQVYAHEQFTEPMLDYIINDFEDSRARLNDNTIGGMVVCDSSDQAKSLYAVFQRKYTESGRNMAPLSDTATLQVQNQLNDPPPILPTGAEIKKAERRVTTAALILHDIGSKQERKNQVDDFKAGKIDFLFVYNMLLTGFDAKRLKKLYLGRVVKGHNLLQTLTRVNRTYGDHRFGYVVDFADIQSEFNLTNKAYFDELQSELGDEMESYSNLFLKPEEIAEKLDEIREQLFHFDTLNAEAFTQQVSQIQDRDQLRGIVKALNEVKSLYNLIRLFGHYDLLERLDFTKFAQLARVANDCLTNLNNKENLDTKAEQVNLLNMALEEVIFLFQKIGEEELILADELKNELRKTRETLASNFDKKDPEFATLYAELERLFKEKKLSDVSQEDMRRNIGELRAIYAKVKELNRRNNLLRAKYEGDEKFARTHKRISERSDLSLTESKTFDAVMGIKKAADLHVLKNSGVLANESYFESYLVRLVMEQFETKNKVDLDPDDAFYLARLVNKEYHNEYHGYTA